MADAKEPPPEPSRFLYRDEIYVNVADLSRMVRYRRNHATHNSYVTALDWVVKYLDELRGRPL